MADIINENLFDNLKGMGFDNLDNVALYADKSSNTLNSEKTLKNTSPAAFLYDRKVVCPVCNKEIFIRSVKSSGIRVLSRDTDFMIAYNEPNPLFYDAWMCKHCGYTALSSKFNAINNKQTLLVKQNITTKWRFDKMYPEVYTADTAMEMYQLALLNAVTIQAKDSEKAMICLKLSWICRVKGDAQREKKFQTSAVQGFIRALESERFPIFGLDEVGTEYLVGEIYRRLGDNNNALLWFSRVLGSRHAKPRIKDMARDQKDVILNSNKK